MAVKLKSLNFKALILKHGEKFLLAVVGALVLFSLVGTKWLPYGGHPREITNKVEEAKHTLATKTWPEEERQDFVVKEDESVHHLVSTIHHQVDPTPYQFTEKFRFDIDETASPITEPKYFTVQSLLADADRMVIYVRPEQNMDLYAEETLDEEGADEQTDSSESEEENIPDAFKMPNRGMRPGMAGGRFGGIPGMFGDEDDEEWGRSSNRSARGTARATGRGRTRGGADSRRTQRFDPNIMGGAIDGMGGDISALMGAGGAGAMAGFGMADLEEFEDMGMGMGGMGFGAGFGSYGSEGRGVRYVAVRGAFPLREQLKEIKKASNLNSIWEAEQLFHIIDFELQRKKRLAEAEDPWSSEWETVDIEVSKEVLREAGEFAPEPHESMVTDAGFTMPLPQRAMGIYGAHATHPALEDWELSEEEMALEMEIQEKLLKEHLEMQADQPEEIVQKRGFADIVHDSRSLMGSLRGGRGMGAMGMGAMGGMGMMGGLGGFDEEDMMEEAMLGEFGGMGMSGFGGALGAFTGGRGVGGAFRPMQDREDFFKKLEEAETDKDKKKLLKEHIQKQLTVEGEMLLFRYLDFDVEPGATYRYRVRVIVTNPNFGRKSSEAAGLEHVVEGQTRTTEWSNATEPVHVPDDVDYFIQSVKTKGGDPMRVEANLTLFQWDPEAGTTVTDRDLEVELGEEIGGYGNPYVLDPAKQRFEIERYEFQTGDLIVDAAYVGSIDPNQHPDLQLPRLARRDPGVSDQVLVVHKDGDLSIVDEKSQLEALALRHQYLTYEQRNFEDIKGMEAKQSQLPIGGGIEGMDEMGEFGGLLGGIYGFDDEDMGAVGRGRRGDDRRGRRGRNSLRKAGGGRGR